MYLRAGVISLGLLLLSRVLGLLRESVQAAAFGTTAVADMVVVMLTLPDLASAILAGGALSYALLPWWARQTPQALADSQRRTSQLFLGAGVLLAAWILIAPAMLGGWLAPGVGEALRPQLLQSMRWAALALPASLLTLVWCTRLQHERDVVGMYGMNVVHTGVVIAAMLLAAALAHSLDGIVAWIGAGLLLAFGARLVFLHVRLRRLAPSQHVPAQPVHGLPGWKIWLWAMLATGAPAALPLLARSLVSGSGEGALATFNYAMKLVDLPNQLAIQIVVALALPAFTRAHAAGLEFSAQLRAAFVLAWTLACAAALGLWLGAAPVTQLMFGWGRMGPAQVAEVGQWAAFGAWMLLPQSIVAVLVLVLATERRLPAAALAYGVALCVLVLSGVHDGRQMMLVIAAALWLAAALLVWAARAQVLRALAWRELAVPLAVLAVLACGRGWLQAAGSVATLAVAALAAMALVAVSWLASPVLRSALKR